jgi:hypothetical protein
MARQRAELRAASEEGVLPAEPHALAPPAAPLWRQRVPAPCSSELDNFFAAAKARALARASFAPCCRAARRITQRLTRVARRARNAAQAAEVARAREAWGLDIAGAAGHTAVADSAWQWTAEAPRSGAPANPRCVRAAACGAPVPALLTHLLG